MTEVMAGRRLATRTRPLEGARVSVPDSNASLWRPEDLLRWAVTASLGGVAIAACWYVAAGDATFAQQIGPTNVAVAGLLLSGVGNAAWLLKGRRMLGERRRALLPDVPVPTTAVAEQGEADRGEVKRTLYVAGEGMERYHRSGCPLAAGRGGWTSMTAERHEAAGRRPCGVCMP